MMAASKITGTTTYPIICVFDDQQHRTVHIHQTSVQSLQAGPVSHSAVGQSPGVTLHASWQATGELRGERGCNWWCFSDLKWPHLMRLRSGDLHGTFSMSVSCNRSLVSLSIGRASADRSQSQLPKLCLRLASSMVMILENKELMCKSKDNMCVRVCWKDFMLTSQLQEAGSPKKLSIMSSSSFSTTTNPCSRASFPYTSGDHWTKNEYRWSTLK